MNDNFKTILKEARERKGLTQEKTAELLGVCSRWIQYLESGKRTPGEKLMIKICDVFPEIQQQQ